MLVFTEIFPAIFEKVWFTLFTMTLTCVVNDFTLPIMVFAIRTLPSIDPDLPSFLRSLLMISTVCCILFMLPIAFPTEPAITFVLFNIVDTPLFIPSN